MAEKYKTDESGRQQLQGVLAGRNPLTHKRLRSHTEPNRASAPPPTPLKPPSSDRREVKSLPPRKEPREGFTQAPRSLQLELVPIEPMKVLRPGPRPKSWVIQPARPPIAPKPIVAQTDFFGTKKIRNMNLYSFGQFIKGMEKVLIMFYSPSNEDSFWPGMEFASAANMSRNQKHGFGAVDCSVYTALCAQEDTCKVPFFKLYSNGFDVATLRQTRNVTASQMHNLIAMSPVLTQPRVIVGKQMLGLE